MLGLPTDRIVRSSAMAVEGHSSQLLARIVRTTGGDTYLAGQGASGYQDDHVFAANGVTVRYQADVHPVYRQNNSNEFVPGMSAIDALMNCGPEAAKLIGSKRI